MGQEAPKIKSKRHGKRNKGGKPDKQRKAARRLIGFKDPNAYKVDEMGRILKKGRAYEFANSKAYRSRAGLPGAEVIK